MNSLLCFLLLATFSLLPIQSFVEAKTHSSFTVDFFHRDSSLSPFYNHSATPGDLARKYVHRAIARANYFSQTFRDTKKIDPSDGNRMEALLNPTSSAYLMKLYVGTPKVEVLALADTGSDLSWIQCFPCDGCYSHKHPLFNPNNSSTYSELSCSASLCRSLEESTCQQAKCVYSYGYRDKSHAGGVLSTDTFTFDSTDGQLLPFPNFTFGCGHNNYGKFDRNSAGLVGLGGGPLSLVYQLGDQIEHKFSYCLQPITAKSSSKLRFGTGAVISGEGIVSTRLIQRSGISWYYLNLQGVSVGHKKIVKKQSAPGEDNKGNTIIDSGTTLTVLHPSSFYIDVEAAVKEAVGLKPVQEQGGENQLCYDATSLNAIPEMTMVFHFTGADVTLKKMNIFQTFNDVACLAMIPAEVTDEGSIFGNVAQINFRVEYDLAKNQVSFAPADCTQFK